MAEFSISFTCALYRWRYFAYRSGYLFIEVNIQFIMLEKKFIHRILNNIGPERKFIDIQSDSWLNNLN